MAGCRAYMGFRLRGDWASDDTDNWRAIAGTALHEWLGKVRLKAAEAAGNDVEFERFVEYRGVPGHVDETDFTNGIITDYKFPAMKSARFWDDPEVLDEKFVQLQGYAAAIVGTDRWCEAAAAARRYDTDATVRLLVAPVDGTFADWRVYERPFDPAVADQAVDRYIEVQRAVLAGDELPRDKERFWCERFCEMFSLCRGDGQEQDWPDILDPEHAAALEQYGQAHEAEAAAKAAKAAAAEVIRGLRGQARGWRVSMTRPGQPGSKPDLAQITADYETSGVELPTVTTEPAAPKLQVKRVKA
jgi:hypothetical protein